MARNDFVIQLGDEDEKIESDNQDEEIYVKKPEITIDTSAVDESEQKLASDDALVEPNFDDNKVNADSGNSDFAVSQPDDKGSEDKNKDESKSKTEDESKIEHDDSNKQDTVSVGTRRVAGIKISMDMDELEKEEPKDDIEDQAKLKEKQEKQKKEEEAKKKIKSNIMTEMAEKGLSMNEDLETNDIKLEIYSKATKKRKFKKNVILASIVAVILGLIGIGTYFGIQNKDMLADMLTQVEIVEKTVVKTEEKIVKEEVIVDSLADKVKSIEAKGYFLIPKETFQNMGREDFYAIYINDIDYVNNLNIDEENKKRFFETVNIAVHGLENGGMDYPAFRKTYNRIVNKVLDKIE